MLLRVRIVLSLLTIIFFTHFCVDVNTIRPRVARDFYEKGLEQLNNKDYTQAILTFKKGIDISDPVADEYYLSMCYFELAFTYSLAGNRKAALQNIEILLSQVVSSKEPRILAENLREKILANKSYQNASF